MTNALKHSMRDNVVYWKPKRKIKNDLHFDMHNNIFTKTLANTAHIIFKPKYIHVYMQISA